MASRPGRTNVSPFMSVCVVHACTIVQGLGGREMPEATSVWPCPWAAHMVTTRVVTGPWCHMTSMGMSGRRDGGAVRRRLLLSRACASEG
jgi:hypothetical protein